MKNINIDCLQYKIHKYNDLGYIRALEAILSFGVYAIFKHFIHLNRLTYLNNNKKE